MNRMLWYRYEENGKHFAVYFCSDENDNEFYITEEEPGE
jgi:YHS domain-containing protein